MSTMAGHVSMSQPPVERVYPQYRHMPALGGPVIVCSVSLTLCAVACRNAYRALLLIYGLVFCGGYIPVMLWIMPDEPFAVGDVYVWGSSWRPVTKLRSELEVRPVQTLLPCNVLMTRRDREDSRVTPLQNCSVESGGVSGRVSAEEFEAPVVYAAAPVCRQERSIGGFQ